MSITVRVKTEEQLQCALEFMKEGTLIIDHASLPEDTERIRAQHPAIRLWMQMPDVLRESKAGYSRKMLTKAELFDGIVIKNLDQLGLLKEASLPENFQVVGDSFLYAYNSSAICFYQKMFPNIKFIISDELTDREFQEMFRAQSGADLNAADFIYKVYGYQPLMVTAQCIRKNYHGCKQGPGVVPYIDEKKNRFYARSECSQCYNLIYNGQPTNMLDKVQATEEGFLIDGSFYPELLVDLTIESAEESKKVLQQVSDIKEGRAVTLQGGFTRGHHYKGVE